MNKDYRKLLFETYNQSHGLRLDADFQGKRQWFRKYVAKYYLPLINSSRKEVKILEIGCGKGFLLEALSDRGFNNLFGVDLSPEDINQATELVPAAHIMCSSAIQYLDNNSENFDVIILKAMLEHNEKTHILPLLIKIKESLKSGGTVIIDVPNMDWLFAPHERYMDFTHETGFTKESLQQLMSNVFSNVAIIPVDNIISSSLFTNIKKTIGRFLISAILSWADPEGSANPIWARSIIGIGKK